jgi:hypothetical protein
MAPHSTNPAPRHRKTSAAAKARRIARALAQSTLLAASMAAVQMGGAEMDARFKLFSPTLVDRLQAPITRHHE